MHLHHMGRTGENLRNRWWRGFAAAFGAIALWGAPGSPPAEARDIFSGLFSPLFGPGYNRSYRDNSGAQGQDTAAGPQDITVIQTALAELGYNTGDADGQSGQKMRDAILLWQRDNGRDPTGTLTPDQASELMTGQAMRRYDAALEKEPQNSDAHVGRGVALILRGELDRARKDFQDAVEADPSNADAYYGQGFLRAAAGEAIGALELYHKAVDLLKERQQRQLEQQQREQQDQLQKRQEQEQQELEKQQQRRLQYTNQQAQPQVLQQQEQQLQDLQKRQEQEREDLSRRQRQQEQQQRQALPPGSYASLYNDVGWLYAGLGRYDEAMPFVDRAIELNPNNAIAYSNRCWIRLQSGDASAAMSDCNLAVGRLNGASASVRAVAFARRSLVFNALGQKTMASRDAARAVAENPLSLVGLLARAQARDASGDQFGASSDYRLVQIFASPAADKSFYHRKLLEIAGQQLARIGPHPELNPANLRPSDLFMGDNNKFFLCVEGGREQCILSQVNMVLGRGTPEDNKRVNDIITRLHGLKGLQASAVKAGLNAFSVVIVKAEGVQAIQAGETGNLSSFITGERKLNQGMEIPKSVLTAEARELATHEGIATGLEGFLAPEAKDMPRAPKLVVRAAAVAAAMYGGYNIYENMAAFSNLLRTKAGPAKS
jgi:tetratricopeptide (TPR) repeat protein